MVDIWTGEGLSEADRKRALELLDEADSEDNERFASWYGSTLMAVDQAYGVTRESLAELIKLIDVVAPAYSESPVVSNARIILGDPA